MFLFLRYQLERLKQIYVSISQVPAGEAKSVFFPIIPAAIGQIPLTVTAQSTLAADGVKRMLLVEVRSRTVQILYIATASDKGCKILISLPFSDKGCRILISLPFSDKGCSILISLPLSGLFIFLIWYP